MFALEGNSFTTSSFSYRHKQNTQSNGRSFFSRYTWLHDSSDTRHHEIYVTARIFFGIVIARFALNRNMYFKYATVSYFDLCVCSSVYKEGESKPEERQRKMPFAQLIYYTSCVSLTILSFIAYPA